MNDLLVRPLALFSALFAFFQKQRAPNRYTLKLDIRETIFFIIFESSKIIFL
jgi:hypothetical protein